MSHTTRTPGFTSSRLPLVCLLPVVLLSALASPILGESNIVNLADMQAARQRFDGAIDSSGNVYALGGYGTWGEPAYSSVERWDPASNVWSSVAPMSLGRLWFGSVFGGDGLLYAIAGETSKSCERYNPVTNSWSPPIADLPQPRAGVSAATDGQGLVYAIGGGPALGSPTNTMWRYDSGSDFWWPRASMHMAREQFGTATDAQGRIYAIGGELTKTMERYDPSDDTWTMLASLPAGSAHIGSAAAYGSGNAIFCFGGWTGSGFVRDILRYDIQDDKWSNWGQMSVAKDNLAAESAPDGNVYFFGGEGPAIHQSQEQMQKLIVPEPATLSLVALGGLAMLYRRRR